MTTVNYATLVAAVIAAAVALLNSRDVGRRWRIDNRRRSYEAFLQAVGELQHTVVARPRSPAVGTLVEELFEHFTAGHEALRRVQTAQQGVLLAADDEMGDAAEDVYRRCQALARAGEETRPERMNAVIASRAAFVELARWDLQGRRWRRRARLPSGLRKRLTR